MTKDDSFIMVNLQDSKKLGQVMSSDTARLILDILAQKDGITETALAKELELPLSTVHYNLQALKKARLVKTDEFHYSKKGKEVLHYKLAKKLIIIAPDSDESWKTKLSRYLPGLGLLAIGTLLIEWLQRGGMNSSAMVKRSADTFAAESMDAAAAPMANEVMITSTELSSNFFSEATIFFLLGGLLVLAITNVYYWWKKK